jgi:hydrogenase maturation protease
MRALIAGLGNVFETDDGFGSAVATVLAAGPLPPGVEVHDFGIRGVHLAYQLLEPYELVVIIDVVHRGGAPGTLYVIEHGADPERPAHADDAPLLDAHDMAPDEVLALVPMLGGALGRVVVIGCEPQSISPGMGLTARVAGSVTRAAELAIDLVQAAAVMHHESAAADEVGIGGG